MPVIFGRLIGAAAGIVAGPFGVLFGFVIGYLVDQVLRERRNRTLYRRFFLNPLGSAPPGIDRASLALIGVVVYACVLQGAVLVRQIDLLRAFLRRSPVSRNFRRRAHLINRSIDQAVRLSAGLNVSELALCLQAHLTDEAENSVTVSFGEYRRGEVAELLSAMVWSDSGEIRKEMRKLFELLNIDAEANDRGLKDAYAILGVPPDAATAEIRAVFRTLAAQFHPDTLGSLDERQRAASAAAFIRIRTAYDTILRIRDSVTVPERTIPPRA
jgi:DnaJ-domain-containing protein 1